MRDSRGKMQSSEGADVVDMERPFGLLLYLVFRLPSDLRLQ